MAAAVVIEDMRSVDPVGYIRAVGLRPEDSCGEKIGKWCYGPEDSLGFCPDFDNSAIYFAWRKR